MGVVQRESIKLTIASYAGAALGYVNKILLFTNFLSTAEVGLIGITTNISLIYAQISALGMVSGLLRFFPFFHEREKKHHGIIFWLGIIVMIGFVITSIGFLAFRGAVIKYFGENSPLLVEFYYYIIPLALAMLYFNFFDAYLRSLLKTVVATVLNEFVSRIMVTVCVSLYALKLINFHQFVVIYIICNCLLTIFLLGYMMYLKQLFIFPTKSNRFKRFFKMMMVYSFFTILSILGASIINNVDSLMIASQLSLGKAGIYTTIIYIATVMVFPYRSLQKIAMPLLARYWKERDMKAMETLYKKSAIINMITGGILFLGLWLNIDSIFKFMPAEYAEAKYAFLYLAIGKYFDLATGLNGHIILTSKKYSYDLWFTLLLVILTVIMNLILIPLYGITGASLATMFTLISYNLLRLWFVKYNFKMQPYTLNCLWIFITTLVVWGFVVLLPVFHNKFVDIAVKSSVITLLYGGSILFFKLSYDVNQIVYKITKLKFLAPKEGSY